MQRDDHADKIRALLSICYQAIQILHAAEQMKQHHTSYLTRNPYIHSFLICAGLENQNTIAGARLLKSFHQYWPYYTIPQHGKSAVTALWQVLR